MKLSVVIPTYNRRHVLVRTIPTVLAQDYPADDWEVVVAVDGSSDGTAEYLRSLRPDCKLSVIEQPNRGQAAALNAGAKLATGELVLFLDDDLICDNRVVRTHITARNGDGSSVVFGRLLIAPESPPSLAREELRAWFEPHALLMERERGPRSPYGVWVAANCSIPRSLFLGIGGCDETLRRGIDTDLAIRLWAAGVPFRFAPAAVARQYYVKTTAEAVTRDGPVDARGELLLCRKHPAYRSSSRLAVLMKPSSGRRFFAWVSCRSPVSPELLLRGPCWTAEKLMSIPLVLRAGIFLFVRRVDITVLRSAVRAAGSWRALRREFGIRLPILAYHHVGPPQPGTSTEFTVSPEQFEKQVRWLAGRGYVGIRPSEWLGWRREGKPLPQKPVLITFDDGYADIAEHALPVVRRYGFSAAVYIVTGQIGGIAAWRGTRGSQSRRLMSAEQIRHWAGEGIEFGAHGRTHADLTELDGGQLREEVEGFRDDLARILAARPTSFAYPCGAYNEAVREQVQRSFDLALSREEGLNGLATDPHSLKRTAVQPIDSLIAFASRVILGWNPMERGRAKLYSRARGGRLSRFARSIEPGPACRHDGHSRLNSTEP